MRDLGDGTCANRHLGARATISAMRRLLLTLVISAASGFVPSYSGTSLPASYSGTSLAPVPLARHAHAVMNAPVGRGVDGKPRRKGEPPACV